MKLKEKEIQEKKYNRRKEEINQNKLSTKKKGENNNNRDTFYDCTNY